ncbi:MAG TPA: phage tail sheath subtilisin-like domain-containing protein [Bradyrhizobium sp.]|jgi:phage tail sheath gpL-like
MAISTGIPNSWKMPLFWAVVDGSKAGNLSEAHRALLVGQKLASGTADDNVPVPVGSVALAGEFFGVGSMLHRMVQQFFTSNTTQQLWAVPVPDGTGTKAQGSIAITSPPTTSGLLTIYIAGQKVEVAVASTDTADNVATNLAAAINAIADLPVTATAATSTVTLECKWAGVTGNDISVVANYLGASGAEALPTGMALTMTAFSGGTGEPDFTAAISAIQALEFDYVALPYGDAASLTTWATEYGFGPTGRWNYTRQQYGIVLNARRDTYANLLTWGIAQNQPVVSTLGIEADSPSPIWEWAAGYCAVAALGFSDDPARPLQSLEMPGLLPARVNNLFSQAQNNALVNSGVAAQGRAPSGNPMILREQTQYQLNSFGQADTAFGLLTILTTLQELLRRMKSAITTKYPRVKLVPDGTRLGPGQAAVQPIDIKAELISEFNAAMFDGLVSNLAAFKNNLVVEIDDNDPNRVNVLWPPQLAGQMRQFAALAQFRLMYPTAA